LENIRKALLTDLGSIAEYYGPKGDTPLDPFTSAERMKQMISLNDLVVAEVDGSFAGFVYFFVNSHPWFEPEVESYGHILEVHVKEEYQGLGIATRILEYAMEDLKKQNVNVIYIDTGGDNAKAIRLYEKMGFREFGRTIHFKKIIG
jgi:ribosomal protein S18 acetylase RimI-like enzyme